MTKCTGSSALALGGDFEGLFAKAGRLLVAFGSSPSALTSVRDPESEVLIVITERDQRFLDSLEAWRCLIKGVSSG